MKFEKMRAKRELYRMEAYMLEIKNLSKGYDGREVLHQLNMKVVVRQIKKVWISHFI